MRPLTEKELTGQARSHIEQCSDPRFAAHPAAVTAFLAMRTAASTDGFDLQPFSTFRDFGTQCRIWNKKCTGAKPLYDEAGQVRDRSSMSDHDIVRYILNWSAVPGGSRHHWGSEIDVVDGNAMPAGYKVQLLPSEVNPGGIFHPLHTWLDANIETFGFFRPYAAFRGGMFAEPWHLSYRPVSEPALRDFRLDTLSAAIRDAVLEKKSVLLEMLPEIFKSHVQNIC
jgi:LAS superfamily LD-carboxypeptidase LdcB